MDRTTRLAAVIASALLLPACSTLNEYGIGGPPLMFCRNGLAYIDDRIAGPDGARVSVIRRFEDGDELCKK